MSSACSSGLFSHSRHQVTPTFGVYRDLHWVKSTCFPLPNIVDKIIYTFSGQESISWNFGPEIKYSNQTLKNTSAGPSQQSSPFEYSCNLQVHVSLKKAERRDMSKFARSSKTCEKLEKSQFLLKLIKTSVRRGRRVPSKNYDFCNFCDFSKTCEKLEKSQFLLKLRQVLEEGEGCPAKTAISVVSAISPKICKKWEKSQCLLKLLNSSGKRGIRRVPSKHYDFCNFCDFSKNCEKLEKSQFLLKLLHSSGKGRRKVPNKNCDFISAISPKIGKSLSWWCFKYDFHVWSKLDGFRVSVHSSWHKANSRNSWNTFDWLIRPEKKIRNTCHDSW